MKQFDEDSFIGMLKEFDDSKTIGYLEEYGIADIPEGSDETLKLFRPFLDFSKAEKPADVDISADVLSELAENLSDLVGIFTNNTVIDTDIAFRNIDSVKQMGRRRVL